MEPFVDRYRGLAFGAILILSLVVGVSLILPFVPALLWAVVLSVLTFPLYRRMEKGLSRYERFQAGHGATIASLFTTLFTLVLICVPFVIIGLGLFVQIGGVTADLAAADPDGQGLTIETFLRQADQVLGPFLQSFGAGRFSIADYVAEHREQIAEILRAPVGRFAGQALFTLLTLVIALLTMFFMLRDGHRLREPALDLIPLPRDGSEAILARISETIRAVFIGTILVAILQGTIIGVAYEIAGVENALLLGVASVILCIVPLLGAPVLYVPVSIALFVQGNLQGALIVLLTGIVIVSNIDNFLKPFFISERVNLHPMGIFFSILGGVLMIGPIGVMAGPMLLTFVLAMQDIVRERLKLEAQVDGGLPAVPADA
jgi:predicted PurR-regulated permease PerM